MTTTPYDSSRSTGKKPTYGKYTAMHTGTQNYPKAKQYQQSKEANKKKIEDWKKGKTQFQRKVL
jgi:hypothetical protein